MQDNSYIVFKNWSLNQISIWQRKKKNLYSIIKQNNSHLKWILCGKKKFLKRASNNCGGKSKWIAFCRCPVYVADTLLIVFLSPHNVPFLSLSTTFLDLGWICNKHVWAPYPHPACGRVIASLSIKIWQLPLSMEARLCRQGPACNLARRICWIKVLSPTTETPGASQV